MSWVPYETAAKVVDEFLQYLSELGVDIGRGSRTESDALAVTEVVEIWKGNIPRPVDPRPVLRAALGFADFAGKIMAIKDFQQNTQLDAHLKLMSFGSFVQNRQSPVTDSVSNKMIELYFAALALKFATGVSLDDPNHSRGDNPDVMLNFRSERWALALKTLASARNPQTIFDNIKKGSDQIEASDAERGLVVINLKNVIKHSALWPVPNVPCNEEDARNALLAEMDSIIHMLGIFKPAEWVELFGPKRKAKTPVIFVAQSAFFAQPDDGGQPAPMPLKILRQYLVPENDPFGAVKLARSLNHHMQPLI